jgi:hypothetical protein
MPVCSRIALDESGRWLEDQFGCDCNRIFQATVNGALVGEETVYPLRRLPLSLISLQLELGVYPPDDQYAIFHFDFTDCFGHQTIVRSRDLTRLQRASKGAGQSTGRRRDDVIERGRARLDRPRRHFVVLGHRAVDTKNHRLGLGRQIRSANRPLHALDSNFGTVHDVGH